MIGRSCKILKKNYRPNNLNKLVKKILFKLSKEFDIDINLLALLLYLDEKCEFNGCENMKVINSKYCQVHSSFYIQRIPYKDKKDVYRIMRGELTEDERKIRNIIKETFKHNNLLIHHFTD